MCEPHSAGEWRDSPLKAPAHNHHLNTSSATRMAAEEAEIMQQGSTSSLTSPLSPPTSPSTSCHAFQPSRPQPMDMLASQLRKQSLEQYHRGTTPGFSQPPAAALSPSSLPDDDFVNVRSVLCQRGSVSMDIDDQDDAVVPASTAQPEGQEGLIYPDTQALDSSPETSYTSPIAIDPTAFLDTRSHGSRTIYGPHFDDFSRSLEVDEGDCEDEEDFSWLESAMSLRSAGMASGMTSGITDRYGLRYRTSAEAASRCRNAIHSLPRMRRRDKRRKRQPRSEASTTGLSASASKMVASVQ